MVLFATKAEYETLLKKLHAFKGGPLGFLLKGGQVGDLEVHPVFRLLRSMKHSVVNGKPGFLLGAFILFLAGDRKGLVGSQGRGTAKKREGTGPKNSAQHPMSDHVLIPLGGYPGYFP